MSSMFPQYTHWTYGRGIFGTSVASMLNVIGEYMLDTCWGYILDVLQMWLVDILGGKWSRACNVPKMFLLVFRIFCPQCYPLCPPTVWAVVNKVTILNGGMPLKTPCQCVLGPYTDGDSAPSTEYQKAPEIVAEGAPLWAVRYIIGQRNMTNLRVVLLIWWWCHVGWLKSI